MGLFGGGSAHTTHEPVCVACLRKRSACELDPNLGSAWSNAAVSFYPPGAPARGRVMICRTCCREANAAFAPSASMRNAR